MTEQPVPTPIPSIPPEPAKPAGRARKAAAAADTGVRSPAREEYPTRTWICENAHCEYFRKPRQIPRGAHLGRGLYLVGNVMCHCGTMPVLEPRQYPRP